LCEKAGFLESRFESGSQLQIPRLEFGEKIALVLFEDLIDHGDRVQGRGALPSQNFCRIAQAQRAENNSGNAANSPYPCIMDLSFARHMPMDPMKDQGCTASPDVLPLFYLPSMRGDASFALYQIAPGFIRGNRGGIAPTVLCDHGVEMGCRGRPPRLPFPCRMNRPVSKQHGERVEYSWVLWPMSYLNFFELARVGSPHSVPSARIPSSCGRGRERAPKFRPLEKSCVRHPPIRRSPPPPFDFRQALLHETAQIRAHHGPIESRGFLASREVMLSRSARRWRSVSHGTFSPC